jgi:hypothetical protein
MNFVSPLTLIFSVSPVSSDEPPKVMGGVKLFEDEEVFGVAHLFGSFNDLSTNWYDT